MDQVAISESDDGYSWAEAVCDSDGRLLSFQTLDAGVAARRQHPVACGQFSFSSAAALVRSIVRCRGDFVEALSLYGEEQGLKATRVEAWYDFGHLRNFYRSRRIVTTNRAFNSLVIDGTTVRKYSASRSEKISCEAAWYAELPPSLRVYTARLIDVGLMDDGTAFYDTEYEYLPTLAELYVFGRLGRPSWHQIIGSCAEFLEACVKETSAVERGASALEFLVRDKTFGRLERFAREAGIRTDTELRYKGRHLPSLEQIARDAVGRISYTCEDLATVMHGDFCLSNILYNPRVKRVRVIDPRGYYLPGCNDLYGDVRYDLAKLGHSIVGRYDHIICGRYRTEICGNDHVISFDEVGDYAWIEGEFRNLTVGSFAAGSDEVRAIMITLFLSMLPLHSDRPDRQQAFIANALRLYADLS
jgi:hypothetical protein